MLPSNDPSIAICPDSASGVEVRLVIGWSRYVNHYLNLT